MYVLVSILLEAFGSGARGQIIQVGGSFIIGDSYPDTAILTLLEKDILSLLFLSFWDTTEFSVPPSTGR